MQPISVIALIACTNPDPVMFTRRIEAAVLSHVSFRRTSGRQHGRYFQRMQESSKPTRESLVCSDLEGDAAEIPPIPFESSQAFPVELLVCPELDQRHTPDHEFEYLYDLLAENEGQGLASTSSTPPNLQVRKRKKMDRLIHILWVDESKRKNTRKSNQELEFAAKDCVAGVCAFTVCGYFIDEGYVLALSRHWNLVVVHVEDEAASSFAGR